MPHIRAPRVVAAGGLEGRADEGLQQERGEFPIGRGQQKT